VPIDNATALKVAAIVLKEAQEGSDLRAACEFVPGIGVQVDANGKALSILFCFDCNEFMVIENGKRFDVEGIGFSRDALLDLFKPLFPDDKSFQKSKRSTS
jgi:hypothetical protein